MAKSTSELSRDSRRKISRQDKGSCYIFHSNNTRRGKISRTGRRIVLTSAETFRENPASVPGVRSQRRRRRESDLLAAGHPLFRVYGETRPNVRYPSFRFYSQKLSIETGLRFDHLHGIRFISGFHLAFPSISRHAAGTGSTRRRRLPSSRVLVYAIRFE